MKSARGPGPGPNRAGGLASNFPVRLAAPRLHNRTRGAPPPTTFQRRSPEGPRGSRQTRRAALRRGEGAPQPPSPRDQLRVGIVLLPTSQASSLFLEPAPVPPRPPALSLWVPSERVAADPCASGLSLVRRQNCSGTLFEVPHGPECGRQAGEAGSPRWWAELGLRGRRGACLPRARPAPRALSRAFVRSRRSPLGSRCPPRSRGPPWVRRAQVQPFCCYRSRRRGRGARPVRAGCWGAIGPPALLRSSASYLCKVKLLTHRKPF